MKKLILAISVFILFGSSYANAEQVYYCSSEIATGIIKDEKTGNWREGSFKQERYTIKFSSDFSKLWGVDLMGGFMLCQTPFNYLNEKYNHFVVCNNTANVGFVFMFDKINNRFTNSTAGVLGYLSGTNESNATDVLYAGTCKKF